MLHIEVPNILVNQMATLVIVEKFYQLDENIYGFVHRAVLLITAKVKVKLSPP